jgi:hypothetical protein
VEERYDLRDICLPRQIALADAVAAGKPPPNAPRAAAAPVPAG